MLRLVLSTLVSRPVLVFYAAVGWEYATTYINIVYSGTYPFAVFGVLTVVALLSFTGIWFRESKLGSRIAAAECSACRSRRAAWRKWLWP